MRRGDLVFDSISKTSEIFSQSAQPFWGRRRLCGRFASYLPKQQLKDVTYLSKLSTKFSSLIFAAKDTLYCRIKMGVRAYGLYIVS